MKKLKNSIFYLILAGFFSGLIYWLVQLGSQLEKGKQLAAVDANGSRWNEFITALVHNLQHPLTLLLAQIITIILVARIPGWLCKQIGQPAVIGEIAAGIYCWGLRWQVCIFRISRLFYFRRNHWATFRF